MRTQRIPAYLLALTTVASVGNLYGQQPQAAGINQRDAAAATAQPATQNKMHAEGMPLKQAIVHKLLKANDAEIELANLAMQRSENQEVQQLAKMLVQDHQAFNQKLQALRDSSVPATRTSGAITAGADTTGTANNRNRQGNQTEAVRDTQTPGQGRSGAAGQGSRGAADAQAATNRQPTDAQGNADRGQRNPNANRDMVPQQLTQIMDQACDTSLKMTKEMLQKHQGQDFSMAFLGQQAVAHTMMLAELQAIQSQGPEELKAIAQEASGKVQQHLEQTKQLAKKLEDDRGTVRAANLK